MFFKAIIVLVSTLCAFALQRGNLGHNSALLRRAKDSAQDHTAADWIWTTEANAGVSRAFRNLYQTPIGKFARFGVCQITADNSYAMYVNGAFIASNPDGTSWNTGQRLYLDLSERSNLFAFNVTNWVAGPAGLLVACRIVYSDGSMDTLLTDTTWYTIPGQIPANFQSPLFFQSSSWVPATNEGLYGIAPWSTDTTWLPLPPVIGLSSSNWIWTSEYSASVSGDTTRPFRFSFCVPAGKTAEYAIILITADNDFTFYVNGNMIGMGTDWTVGYRYVVPVKGLDNILFAAAAYNYIPSPAALIAAIQIVYSDGSTDSMVTDGSWKTVTESPPTGFQNPGFDDSAWSSATVVNKYGAGPWVSDVVVPPI